MQNALGGRCGLSEETYRCAHWEAHASETNVMSSCSSQCLLKRKFAYPSKHERSKINESTNKQLNKQTRIYLDLYLFVLSMEQLYPNVSTLMSLLTLASRCQYRLWQLCVCKTKKDIACNFSSLSQEGN